VYVLHFEPAYRHARHYVGWAVNVDARVQLATTMPGSRFLERRLKRWHNTGQFCPVCRAARGGRAR
jgi:hypothetical protein